MSEQAYCELQKVLKLTITLDTWMHRRAC